MSDARTSKEKFREVEPILNTMLAVRNVAGNGEWIKLNTFGGYLNAENARALRDWLSKALPSSAPEPCECPAPGTSNSSVSPFCRLHAAPPGRYSIEPHGDGHALYRDRSNQFHGLNLAYITEAEPEALFLIERALNAGASQPPAPAQEMAPPYWTRTFWSPCRRYLVTAHSCQGSLTVQDDDGCEWEPTGDEKNINAGIPARAVPTKGGEQE